MTPRRTTALVLVVVFALTAAACGGGGDGDDNNGGGGGEDAAADLPDCPVDVLEAADGPVEVLVWHQAVAKGLEALQTVTEAYNRSQDRVVVRLESQGVSFEEIQRAYNQAIASGDLPDIAVLEDTQTQAMADSGTVLPAQSCIDAEGYDTADLVPTILDYYSVDGAQVPASMLPSTALLYFNREHLVEAGLDPDEPPGTLDEVREAAEALQAAGVSEEPFILHLAPWLFEFWLTGGGTAFVDNDNGRGDGTTTESVLASEETIELLTFFQDMAADGLLQVVPNVEGQLNHYLALAQRSGSIMVESSAAVTSVEAFLQGELDASDLSEDQRVVLSDDLDLDLDIDAAPFPGVDGPGQIQVGGGVLYMTNVGDDAHQAASWDFMKYLNSVEGQQVLNLIGGWDPINLRTPDQPEVAETWDTTLSGAWLRVSFDQMVDGIDPDFPGPLVGPYTELRTAVRIMLEEVLLNGADPASAAADAEAEITAALERYEEENF